MEQSPRNVMLTAISRLDSPAAIVMWRGATVELLAASSPFLSHTGGESTALQLIIAAPEGGPVPIGEGSELYPTDLGSGLVLWQVRATAADALSADLARLLAESQSGAVAFLYFDRQHRLRAWNDAVSHFFPDARRFPVMGGTFEDQLDSIIADGLPPLYQGHEDVWRTSMVEAFWSQKGPQVGRTPSGLWAISATTRLGDGSTLHMIADVSLFKEREEQIKSFMANAEGLLFCRRQLGSREVAIWGSVARELTGASKQNAKGFRPEQWLHIIDERDRDMYVETMKRHWEDQDTYSIEFRFHHPVTGAMHWIREDGWISRDSHGIAYHDSLLADITEQKAIEKARLYSESRFRHFAELASDWFFETDGDFCLTYVSDRCADVIDVNVKAFLGRPWAQTILTRVGRLDPQYAQAWHQLWAHCQRHEPFRDWAVRIRDNSKRLKIISLSADPRFDENGRFVGYRGIGRDVTDLVRARESALTALERAERASAAKSAFIANMSHELRTPLNAIIGFSNIMAQEIMGPLENDRYRAYAQDIAVSGEHLLSLVNDLLDLSRIEANEYKINKQPLDLAAEIERTLALFRSDIESRTLSFAAAAAMPPVQADPRALRQMLINIVGNAFKFSDEGSRIEVALCADEAGRPQISVTDNGIGMREEDISPALEPFGRAPGAENLPGTGLGLPLTRRLIELHGGRLELESGFGVGTTVRLIFPEAEDLQHRLAIAN